MVDVRGRRKRAARSTGFINHIRRTCNATRPLESSSFGSYGQLKWSFTVKGLPCKQLNKPVDPMQDRSDRCSNISLDC